MLIFNKNISLKKAEITSRIDLRLIFVLIIYTVLGIFLFKYYQYQINPDGINYINIAKSYMTGDFYGSINDYWGPLLSWLLIPFLYFGQIPVTALYSAKIFSLMLGFFTLIGIRQLSYRFEMDEIIRTVILFTMIPAVLYFSLSVISPDLLMLCVLVYYLAIIFNLDYPNKLSYGVLCGIFGALAYLSKSYGFTFFIATFLILNILQYFRNSDKDRRNKVLKNFVLGFAIFLMISGVWIGLISYKDVKLTFGTAGESNYAKVAPQIQGFNYTLGIYEPGDDNPNFVVKQWSPFSSWSNFKYQLNLIGFNSYKIGFILFKYFSFLSLIIILVYIILCIQPPRKLLLQNEIIYPLVTLIISAGGYVMILVLVRYIWLINVLLILMGGYLINLLFKTDFFRKEGFARIKTVILLVFAFSFVIMPVNYLIQNVHTGEDDYNLSQILINQYDVQGNVATSTDKLTKMENLKYYMNISTHGVTEENLSDLKLQQELKKNNIDYYFVWDNPNQFYDVSEYKEITGGKIKNLKVYYIIKKF